MRDAAAIFLRKSSDITGSWLRAHSSAPVVAELADAVDELNRDGTR